MHARLLFSSLVLALCAMAADPWAPYQFLIGDWTGGGGGASAGQGAGSFSFRTDLQGRILVRRNSADYPAANGKPASRHDDLMIVYSEEATKPQQAVYFDNEGHVIRYAVETAPDTVRFVSPPEPAAPRYRLTYRKTGSDTIAGQFEIAPPGKPEAFASYMTWTARRSPAARP